MSEIRYYYADATNQPVGPFSADELSAMLKSSILSSTTQVCPEGGDQWTNIGTVIDIEMKVARTAYQEVAEKVGLVPDLSGKRNLIQVAVTIPFVLIGAIWGAVVGGSGYTLGFGFLGLILGVLVSGSILMVMGWKK